MKRGPKPSAESLAPAKFPPASAEELVLELVKHLAFYGIEWDDIGLVETGEGKPPARLALPTNALFSDQGKRARIALILVNDWTKRRDLNLRATRRRKAKA